MIFEEFLRLKGVRTDFIAALKVARVCRGTALDRLVKADMVIITNMLTEMILPLKSVRASVFATVNTRVSGCRCLVSKLVADKLTKSCEIRVAIDVLTGICGMQRLARVMVQL